MATSLSFQRPSQGRQGREAKHPVWVAMKGLVGDRVALCREAALARTIQPALPSLIPRRNVVIVPMVSAHFSIISKQIQLLSICHTQTDS